MMRLNRFMLFASKFALAHAATYVFVGAICYQLLTKQFYEGTDPIFARFMRTPEASDQWQHVMKWFIPGQILRGVLMAIAIYPFFDTLISWRWAKRFWAIAGLYLILGFWASAVDERK